MIPAINFLKVSATGCGEQCCSYQEAFQSPELNRRWRLRIESNRCDSSGVIQYN